MNNNKNVVVIGGIGHIGSFLVPALVKDGFNVTVISKSADDKPYTADYPEWKSVKIVGADRRELEKKGEFGRFIAGFEPEIVCDLIAFTREQEEQLVNGIRGIARHIISIGSIWVYDYKETIPVTEDHPHNSVGEYGIGKTAIENYLKEVTKAGIIDGTIVHPGHVSGPGWLPLNPQGNLNPKVFEDIVNGREILLPNCGVESLQHVHSADIAGVFLAAIHNPEKSRGEAFHATAPKAMTTRGYAEGLFRLYGHEPKIKYADWNEFKNIVSAEDAEITLDHISHSPACSMEKAERLLGFKNKYTLLETIKEAIDWQIEKGLIVKE